MAQISALKATRITEFFFRALLDTPNRKPQNHVSWTPQRQFWGLKNVHAEQSRNHKQKCIFKKKLARKVELHCIWTIHAYI
jgi:hypothetical protein